MIAIASIKRCGKVGPHEQVREKTVVGVGRRVSLLVAVGATHEMVDINGRVKGLVDVDDLGHSRAGRRL